MNLELPDTPTSNAAIAFAKLACPPFLMNHNFRTFLFGCSLVDSTDLDREAALVASVLHDIALTDDHRGATSFELIGADIAARFLESEGWQPDRIRLVENAIIRHTNLVANDGPVERVVQAGAALDVAGIPLSAINTDDTRTIIARYPRLNFATGISEAYHYEIATQPSGVFAKLEQTVQLSKLITSHPFDVASIENA